MGNFKFQTPNLMEEVDSGSMWKLKKWSLLRV
jgi:hypothetical protein